MAEIQAEQKRWVLFKNALRDLMCMCKAAVTRLNSSAKSARFSSENQKRTRLVSAPEPQTKKKKKVTNTSLFQWIPAEVKGITSMRLDTDSKPESEVNFLQPMVFRTHPEAQTLYLYI